MQPLTEQQEKVLYLRDEEGLTFVQIGRSLGITDNAARKSYNRAAKRDAISDSPGVVDIATKMGIGAESLSHGWVKHEDGSFFFKLPKFNEMDENKITDILKDVFDYDIPRIKELPRQSKSVNKDLLTKYILADIHMGMFAWAEECGDDYDLKIAEATLHETMDNLIAASPDSDTAVILNLGDYFHANDQKNMTPGSGHILDMDSRFPKIATVGIRALRYVIEKAATKHEKVIYCGVPGNHDPDQSHWLTLAMMEAFRDHPRVEIQWNPSAWFMLRWGKTLLTAHHGDRTNFNRLAMAVPELYSKEWGKSYWRILDTGHVHHQKEQELGGLLVRSHRTIAAKDAYAVKSAYVAKRTLSSQTYHKERGEIITNSVHLFNGKVPI